jgi:SSS family solute:Na+ symporter
MARLDLLVVMLYMGVITVAYDFLVGGLPVAVLGAILWRRGTATAALASIAVGSILVCLLLALKGIDSDWPIYVGLGGSLTVYLLVSLSHRLQRRIEA